ncbi:MAG: alpha/beta fold hydrolase [Salinibacterium sp.]|nr:alpha/beta fold hydrolase [Salinibacterium sp.]
MTVPQIAITKPRGPAGAPLVVLGASLGTTTVLWDGAAAFLSDRFRVLAFDHPGHGSSPAARDSFTVAEIGTGLLRALDSIGEREFHYAGLSFAGAVGLELLLTARERVTSAAIVCSGAKIGEAPGWHERAAAVRANGTASLVSGAAERWFAPGSIDRNPHVTARLLNDLRDTDDESYALCCEALARYDVRGMLGQVAPPVLAIWAEHDEVTPESSASLIANGVQVGRIHQIADASHLAPAEQPAAVAAAMSAFFSGAR